MPGATNTQFALAIHVLTLLSGQAPALVNSQALAASTGASPEHLRRVLAPLRRGGLVCSRSGPHGGWQLDRAGPGTTLAEVWRAVDANAPMFGIHEASPECDVGQRIHSALMDLERRAEAELLRGLGQQTVGGLVTPGSR